MPSLEAAREMNASFIVPYTPVAVFVGGTSGIGEGTAGALARATKGNAHIILCGRNKENAERIMATFPRTDRSRYEFIQCDARLMKNVVACAAEIKAKVETVNYLVLSQGIIALRGFDPTSEGIDAQIAVNFYSRWKFVDELMPCLQKASDDGQEVRVMDVMNAGSGTVLDPDALGFNRKSSIIKALRQFPTYHDMMVEEYAQRHPSMSFIHVYPGFVKTPIGKDLPWIVRSIFAIAALRRDANTSITDCGEWMESALINPAYKHGAFHLGERANPVAANKLVDMVTNRSKLIDHYEETVAIRS